MRWLVTGGCGFIGRNLIKALLLRPNVAVRVVDDLSIGTRQGLAEIGDFVELNPTRLGAGGDRGLGVERLEFIVGDIRDGTLAARVTTGVNVMVHLAANAGVGPSVADPLRDCTTNVVGMLNYLEACRQNGISRFVFASSGAPVGNCKPPLHEELPAHPVSPYGASKLAGEAYCSAYKESFGIDAVALRFGNCYGPLSSHKSSIVAKFIREALAGQQWEIYGDGRQTRDFIFVDDVVAAIVLAGTTEGVGGQVFQIATASETNIQELAHALRQVLERRGVGSPRMCHREPRIGDIQRNYFDTSKARARLGWIAQVSLQDGLDRTVSWFLERRSGS